MNTFLRSSKFLIAFGLLLSTTAASSANSGYAEFSLSKAEIAAENERLKSLGIDLKGQDFLDPNPFAMPPKARPYVLPLDWYSQRPEKVSAEDLLKDLGSLEAALRLQYSGWEVAERRGWNWAHWFGEWRSILAKHGTKDIHVSQAFAPLEELQRFQPDNHTGPMVSGAVADGDSRTALLVTAPSGPATQLINSAGETFTLNPADAATQPQAILLGSSAASFAEMQQGYSISYPSKRGTAVAVVAGGKRISLVEDFDPKGAVRENLVLELSELKKDTAAYRRVDADIGILRLPSMVAAHATAYENLKKSIFSLSDGQEKVVIIDVRQNGGGGLYFEPLLRWFSPQELLGARAGIIRRTTTKYSFLEPALSWGYLARAGHLDEPVNAARLRETVDILLQESSFSMEPEFEVNDSGQGMSAVRTFDPAQSPTKPIMLLLIDNGCASNCEALFGLLSRFPNVLIAGVNSYGVGEFGSVGDILLPRTKVGFRIATNHNEIYSDGRSFDGYGGKPDVLLNTEETNSPAYLLKLAEDLAKLK